MYVCMYVCSMYVCMYVAGYGQSIVSFVLVYVPTSCHVHAHTLCLQQAIYKTVKEKDTRQHGSGVCDDL